MRIKAIFIHKQEFLVRKLVLALFLGLFLASCAPSRPSCQTMMGKKKLKYYNSIQYRTAYKY